MASAMDIRADSVLEGHRPSLLEVIEDKNRALNKKNLVHRVIIIGKLKEEADRNEVGNYHEQLLKNLQNTNQTEPITGLLLVYMKHLVHVMECSADAIMATVRDLKQSKTSKTGLVENAKILVISHDIQNRLYQQWSFRQLDIVAARIESLDSNESTDKVVIDLVTQLLKLGNALAKTPKLNLKNVMDSLHEKLPDLLPQQAVLHYLMEDEDPCMITLEEYINLEEQPFDVVLESEGNCMFDFHKQCLTCYYNYQVILISLYYKINA
ncbi:testis-expressed protein 47-like isoform X3 [Crassostrea virginica]